MTPLIQQIVRFRISPEALSVSRFAPPFSFPRRQPQGWRNIQAFDGQLEGENLLIVPGKQIRNFGGPLTGRRRTAQS